MVAISPNAEAVIRRLIDRSDADTGGLRIMVDQGGCSGMQYKLGIEREPRRSDRVFDFDGVKIFVDPFSLALIDGLKVDFVETLETSGFVFENPNAGDVCSCGKSFST